MQAVILAAGRGTRMGALTEMLPKPMLTVRGKTLLEHKFDALPETVQEIILIVGYKKEVIINRYGEQYQGKSIRYIEQKNIVGGTADALWQARDFLKDRFMVMMGDDIYAQEDIAACLSHEWSVLVSRVKDTSRGGKVVFDAAGNVVEIIEHPISGEGVVNTNLFVLDTRLFEQEPVEKDIGSSEKGLPQTILAAAQHFHIPLHVVEAQRWIQITTPEDVARVEALLA